MAGASPHADCSYRQLLFFYSLAPLIMLAVSFGELWCLLTRQLAPRYVLYGSLIWMLVWSLEVTFWTVCGVNTERSVPDLCPVVFREGKGVLFTLSSLGIAEGATAGAAGLIFL